MFAASVYNLCLPELTLESGTVSLKLVVFGCCGHSSWC